EHVVLPPHPGEPQKGPHARTPVHSPCPPGRATPPAVRKRRTLRSPRRTGPHTRLRQRAHDAPARTRPPTSAPLHHLRPARASSPQPGQALGPRASPHPHLRAPRRALRDHRPGPPVHGLLFPARRSTRSPRRRDQGTLEGLALLG